MVIKDRVYGKIQVKSKVIQDLIRSVPFQRLKKISQDGASHFIQPARNVTRYEHSIGVWYLSKLYKRSIEEQIASLLHDLPHTAFSHVIDVVIGNVHTGDFHEQFLEDIITNSEIPSILEKAKIKLKKVMDLDEFTLLENSLPDISVDRLDYFLRDGVAMGFLSNETTENFLNNLKVHDQNLCFSDVGLAATFAILFANLSRLVWLDPTSHGAYFLLSEAIKIALNKKYITQDDFFTTDDILMKKLVDTNNKDIAKLLKRLSPGNEFVYATKSEAEFYGPSKPRYVDPLVKTKNGLERVSDLVPSLKYFFEEFSRNYKNLGVKPA